MTLTTRVTVATATFVTNRKTKKTVCMHISGFITMFVQKLSYQCNNGFVHGHGFCTYKSVKHGL